MAGRRCTWCHFAHQQTDIGDTTEQLAVARWIRAINTIRQDCDGVATKGQCCAMGRPFDAVSTARNDDPLGGGQVGGERPGNVLAVGGCGSRAGDGHEVGKRACEERRGPASPKHVGSPLTKIAERAGPLVVAGDQDAEPGSSCLEETLVK